LFIDIKCQTQGKFSLPGWHLVERMLRIHAKSYSKASWFDPVSHLQLAVKTDDTAELMGSYCIGIIYFHTKDEIM